ncbi:MAG: lysine--tRNA ligase [Pseudomonadota bacterium]
MLDETFASSLLNMTHIKKEDSITNFTKNDIDCSSLQKHALESNAWPFTEAKKLLEQRLKRKVPKKGYVLYETGYGPSGLPHIGTFAEVVRTSLVKNAFETLINEIPTALFCFSDDLDGLRKVPDNIPNKKLIAEHLGKPLTQIPDPYGEYESFGHHNNARLKKFLDQYGFTYQFKSATECYRSGIFDETLLMVLKNHKKILDILLPTLREERKKTYSPFLPISPKTGRILQTEVLEYNVDQGTIAFKDEDGSKTEIPVTGGNCKLQWKCDWAMRWKAFSVDYEMYGKDLRDSFFLSSKICRVIGGTPPNNLPYEMFLDEHGRKISKSIGNGLSVEEWMKYAPQESLIFYMYKKPQVAKKLCFDCIPKSVDEYLTQLSNYFSNDIKQRLNNPIWHIHNGNPPNPEANISFSMILNLVSACQTESPSVLWHYISNYSPGSNSENSPITDKLITYAISFYKDFILPNKKYKKPTVGEIIALQDLKEELSKLQRGNNNDAQTIQTQIYEVGKRNGYSDNLKTWFDILYQILLGQESGPRMGSFVMLYGIDKTINLIDRMVSDV